MELPDGIEPPSTAYEAAALPIELRKLLERLSGDEPESAV